MATCDVTPVRSSGELREFLRLPRLLRGADPHWVEPLRAEQAWLLNRAHHPFYVDGEGATAEFFLARDRRTGRAVGRVAAIFNERYNRHRRESGAAAPVQGFFGFFDSIDSLDVSGALLGSAARWLRRSGGSTASMRHTGRRSGRLPSGPSTCAGWTTRSRPPCDCSIRS